MAKREAPLPSPSGRQGRCQAGKENNIVSPEYPTIRAWLGASGSRVGLAVRLRETAAGRAPGATTQREWSIPLVKENQVRFHKGLGLSGDRLAVRVGYEGIEPRQITGRQLGSTQLRIAVAIYTWQPQVPGAYYFNRSLLALLQDCLLELGMHVVIKDIAESAEEDSVWPEEERGTLELFEEYALLTETGEVRGGLVAWEFDVGVKSPFYNDAVIVDIILEREQALQFRQLLVRRCSSLGVPLKEVGPEEAVSEKQSGGLLQAITRVFKRA